uniref:Uncharacterized protein n=1 Tax=Sphaerodactylus townsendi TaxID=933632 RepID=A0ACB8EKY3_9SAUR
MCYQILCQLCFTKIICGMLQKTDSVLTAMLVETCYVQDSMSSVWTQQPEGHLDFTFKTEKAPDISSGGPTRIYDDVEISLLLILFMSLRSTCSPSPSDSSPFSVSSSSSI